MYRTRFTHKKVRSLDWPELDHATRKKQEHGGQEERETERQRWRRRWQWAATSMAWVGFSVCVASFPFTLAFLAFSILVLTKALLFHRHVIVIQYFLKDRTVCVWRGCFLSNEQKSTLYPDVSLFPPSLIWSSQKRQFSFFQTFPNQKLNSTCNGMVNLIKEVS